MPEIKWIKITTSMFDDEKIKLIESMPEGTKILLLWIKLLTLAGRCNATGYIFLSENIPYTEEMLATVFNSELNIIRLALNTFQNFRMIEVSESRVIKITNWEKYQNIEGLEKIRNQTRQRVANFRSKQKLLTDVTEDVTLRNATDQNKNKKKNNMYTSEFENFWTIYPKTAHQSKANAFKCWNTRLKEGYKPEEVIKGAENYGVWCKNENQPEKYVKNPETFLGPGLHFLSFQEKEKELKQPSKVIPIDPSREWAKKCKEQGL